MLVTATLAPSGRGTKVDVTQDLQLSGAAAQYGRGIIPDVTAVLMRILGQMQDRIERAERGESVEQIAAPPPVRPGFRPRAAGGGHGADRVFRRFFVPYPSRLKEPAMVLWWIGNAVLLLVVLPVVSSC